MKDYRFLDEVYDDLASTETCLESRGDQLGLEFESEFFNAVNTVRSRPESFAPDPDGYRPVKLKRFNAVLHFKIENDVIVVAGALTGGRSKTNLLDRG